MEYVANLNKEFFQKYPSYKLFYFKKIRVLQPEMQRLAAQSICNFNRICLMRRLAAQYICNFNRIFFLKNIKKMNIHDNFSLNKLYINIY